MATVISSINFDRQRFEKVCGYYGKQGIAPQPSLLRIEQDLVNGQGTYEFDLKKENISKVESNLKRNDLFVVISMGVAVRIEDSEHPFVNVPMFAPHKAILDEESKVIVPGFKTDDIKALYNGSLYLSTGTTVNFADMPTALFLKDKGTDDLNLKINHFDFENDLRSMPEEVIFAGTQDHKITVTFPTFAASDYTAQQTLLDDDPETYGENFKSKIVFLAYGYRVVGGTLEKYKEDGNPYKNCI